MDTVPSPHDWVMCDECSKWRRVSNELARSLDEDASWTCRQNPDPAFASCSVPQEWTDEEIDRGPTGSEAEEHEHTQAVPKLQPAVWQHVSDNIYRHRDRRKQHEDDIMICNCPTPRPGHLGCGPNCLNRLLNLECVPEYCPCGSKCSNQSFTSKQYAKLDYRRAGAKGFGLFTKEDLVEGQFVIEYVGEVLEEREYARRKRHYKEIGQRHYYFMSVGNGEVVDACVKGGLGRFINHSCLPNCETQKWLVRGELTIGLFAKADIAAGSELTFDYNFDRYGDKPTACLCESVNCRGFIGGSQEAFSERGEILKAQDASHDPEPIMLDESAARRDPTLQAILRSEVGLEAYDSAQLARLSKLAEERGLPSNWLASVQPPANGTASANSSRPPSASTPTDTLLQEPALPAKLASKKRLTKQGALGGHSEASKPLAASLGSSKDAAVLVGEDLGDVTQTLLPPEFPDLPSKVEDDVELSSSSGYEEARGGVEQGDRGDGLASSSMASTNSSVSVLPPSTALPPSSTHPAAEPAPSSAPRKRQSAAPAQAPAPGHMPAGARASEVDRKLHVLVSRQGRLLEPYKDSIVRVLRLFNLCDFSSNFGPPKALQGGPAVGPHSPSLPSSNAEAIASDGDSAAQPWRPNRWPASGRQVKAQLSQPSPRQRARMADTSLLLDVVMKAPASARPLLIRQGVMRQLQQVVKHCQGAAHAVIARKVLRAADTLPLGSDDMHTIISAYGSFARTLADLCRMAFPHELKNSIQKFLDRYPLSGARPEIQAAVAEAAGSFRELPQHKGLLEPSLKRRSFESGASLDSPASKRSSLLTVLHPQQRSASLMPVPQLKAVAEDAGSRQSSMTGLPRPSTTAGTDPESKDPALGPPGPSARKARGARWGPVASAALAPGQLGPSGQQDSPMPLGTAGRSPAAGQEAASAGRVAMERVEASWNKAAKGRASGWDQPGARTPQPPAVKQEQSRPALASLAVSAAAAGQLPQSSPLPPRAATFLRPHSSTPGHRLQEQGPPTTTPGVPHAQRWTPDPPAPFTAAAAAYPQHDPPAEPLLGEFLALSDPGGGYLATSDPQGGFYSRTEQELVHQATPQPPNPWHHHQSRWHDTVPPAAVPPALPAASPHPPSAPWDAPQNGHSLPWPHLPVGSLQQQQQQPPQTPSEPPPLPPSPTEGQPAPPLPQGGLPAAPPGEAGARTDRWAKPDRAFKHFAMDQVHKAVSAHKLESSKARELGRKIYDTIVQREVEEFDKRTQAKAPKDILREKVQARIREYVDAKVKQLRQAQK